MKSKFYSFGSILIILITIVAIFSGYYMGINNEQLHTSTSKNIYSITLLEIMNNNFNGSMQPRFYMIKNGILTSTSNITIPSHTLIIMTIISYDTPTNGTPKIYSLVNGTINNEITIINGTLATGSMSSNGTNRDWIMNVTSIPVSLIAHTFTVSQIGLNIPIEGGFTEIAEFYVNITGSFYWQCMSPCGLGPSGWSGSMSKPGWMMGILYVY